LDLLASRSTFPTSSEGGSQRRLSLLHIAMGLQSFPHPEFEERLTTSHSNGSSELPHPELEERLTT